MAEGGIVGQGGGMSRSDIAFLFAKLNLVVLGLKVWWKKRTADLADQAEAG